MISLARFAFSTAIDFVRNGQLLQKAFMLAMLLGLEAFPCGHWQIAAQDQARDYHHTCGHLRNEFEPGDDGQFWQRGHSDGDGDVGFNAVDCRPSEFL